MLLFSFSLFLSLFLFIYLFIFALGKREGGEEEEEKHIENRKIGKEGRKRKTWRRRRRRKRKIIDTVFSHGFWGWSIIRPFGCPPPTSRVDFPYPYPLALSSFPPSLSLSIFLAFIHSYLFTCIYLSVYFIHFLGGRGNTRHSTWMVIESSGPLRLPWSVFPSPENPMEHPASGSWK